MSDYIPVSMDATVRVNQLLRQLDEVRAEVERLRGEMPVAESLRVDVKCAEIERDKARDVVWKQAKENADLRAEIERQTQHIEELRSKIDAERSCACSFDAPGDVCLAHSPTLAEARAEIERLTRQRNGARAEVENLYDQIHRWVDDRAKAQSQADRLREQNYELQRKRDEARAEVEMMREIIRTIRARCVELDDSDAVSATLDITSAVLDSKP